MISSKRGVCLFFVLLFALLSGVRGSQVLGPSPPVQYAPVNVTATFTCFYQDFNGDTDAWFWLVDGKELSELDNKQFVSGESNTSTLRASVQQHSVEPVLVMCQLYRRIRKSFFLFANSTNVSQILTYEKPSSPGNLSVSVSEEELSVSWSSPWSPPGVPLSYAVAFLANISNASNGSLHVDYYTAETVLTVNGTDLFQEDGVQGLCEPYQVKVVAESPAGLGLASEVTVPLFKFTGNVDIRICNQSNQFICSAHLLNPGTCPGDAGNYTWIFNTSNGMYGVDVNFMDGSDSVAVDGNVSSAAIVVTTSYGFSRSEFYHFKEEEIARACPSVSPTATVLTFQPSLSLLPTPTVLPQDPEGNNDILMIAVSVGAALLVLAMMVVVVTGSIFCLYQSWKRRERNGKVQTSENGVSASPASNKQRPSVISATHPIYQLPKDACQEYLNEQERNSKAGSRRASTTSMMLVTKDSFAQVGCEQTDHVFTSSEKSRSLPRDSITDISGYSVVPQTLKNEIKRRSSRLNGSMKSHLGKPLPSVNKENLISPSTTTDSSPPLPQRNHYSLPTAESETSLPNVPPPITPPLTSQHMTANGAPCHINNKDSDDPHVYSVRCHEEPKSSSPLPRHLRLASSSPTSTVTTPDPPIYHHIN